VTTVIEIDVLRRETLQAVAALAYQHHLPSPSRVFANDHPDYTYITLTLDFTSRGAVDLWARILGLPRPGMFGGKYESLGFRADNGPIWLGWQVVAIRTDEAVTA
jgi:hypothetical protein